MDLGLEGTIQIVTGAGSGLGRATAEALLADGARVVVSGRRAEPLEELAAAHPDHVRVVRADNADADTPARLLAAAADWGAPDGLLVSVGGPPAGTVSDVDDDAWRQSFESVFLGAVRLARVIGAAMAAGEGGSIALVLSSSVRAPLPGLGISNGLRPGLAMVAKSLAGELGPAGVRVNSLLPGFIDTPRTRSLQGSDAGASRVAGIPLRRVGSPEEFGRVAAFVLSPAASYLSGVALPVDGGAIPSL
ncbi:SDR family oxidoreductase [Nocardioides sp. GY 10127]|uniref:SDR family oxidoreductase n=1 Tax=Nocardioides sp. GY 10127 TaxID=2569762 RepID=UPI0010A8DC4C|nr:SDR family oxidoreductase [Nocardioides sp. GY 10127]TIC86530.1 SDR family oxidoreductase [Nocardioides sp. GY 10127]